jgi:hypothetical protein
VQDLEHVQKNVRGKNSTGGRRHSPATAAALSRLGQLSPRRENGKLLFRKVIQPPKFSRVFIGPPVLSTGWAISVCGAKPYVYGLT